MIRPTFIRCSISLDTVTRDRAKILAVEMASSVSAVIRGLVRDAFEQHQRAEAAPDLTQAAKK